jgi:hypothetical protein
MIDGETSRSGPNDHLRNLSFSDQQKLARDGDQNERTVLERLYQKAVWEALLSNQHITVVEVARIACKGGLPQHLLDAIAGNATWLTNPQVRRGLLTNPRLGRAQVEKILRAMPAHELKLVPKQSLYNSTVRDLARRLAGPGA